MWQLCLICCNDVHQVSVDTARVENRLVSIFGHLLSSCLACCEHLKMFQLVDCSVYEVKSTLGSAFSSRIVLGSTRFVEVDGVASAFFCYAVGVLETSINKINENDKDSSTGKYSKGNYFPMGSLFLKD